MSNENGFNPQEWHCEGEVEAESRDEAIEQAKMGNVDNEDAQFSTGINHFGFTAEEAE